MSDIKKVLGSNIRTYRKNLGISQDKLAEVVDTATNYLGLIERGKKFPSADMIERIAAALGKDSPELFAITPIQHEWKKKLMSRIVSFINKEISALN